MECVVHGARAATHYLVEFGDGVVEIQWLCGGQEDRFGAQIWDSEETAVGHLDRLIMELRGMVSFSSNLREDSESVCVGCHFCQVD